MKVLITGANGNLGQKLCTHLEQRKIYELTRLDLQGGSGRSAIVADLSAYDPTWARHFHGQEAVVHLAADPRVWAPWESLQRNNVDALINVFRAAAESAVKRLVFASSSVAFLGYGDSRTPVTHDAMPKPVNFYGVTKVFGERLGESYAEQYGLSVICLRIGTVWRGDNSPEGKGFQSQRRWLSNRDFCQAAEKAICAPAVHFAALFVTSDNVGKPWDLSETRRVLGFEPNDRGVPVRAALPVRLVRAVTRRTRGWSRRLGTRHPADT